MFPMTVEGNVTKSGKQQCTVFNLGITLFEAFRYAVEKVNNRSVLKGMTLGYDARDTCSRVDESVKFALKYTNLLQITQEEILTNILLL